MASAIAVKVEDAAWRQAHEELVRLATERAGLDFEEGRWLLRAHRAGAHLRLGYASFHEYTERLFGYGPHLTQEKLRVAEALEELPDTARDVQTGAICFSLARELTRIATPSTEQKWLEVSRGRTVREVEHLVAGHRPGSLPDDVPDPGLKRHVPRLDLSGEVFATFREAMAKIRCDAGEALDDDAAILLLCRQALRGPKDPGRSSYQIALTVCECCRRATRQGRGELIEVGPEVVEMAECDGQHIGHVNAHVGASAPEQLGERAHVGAPDDADARAHVGAPDDADARAHVGAPDDADARAHVGAPDDADARAHVGAPDDADARAHVGAPDDANGHANARAHVGARGLVGAHHDTSARAHVGRARGRAAQTIPPKIRREVFHRDGGKCRVPGCRDAVFTDVHHIVLRSEHGTHSPENLVTLCAAHHQRIHEGKLTVTGSASSHLDFTHADAAPYGGAVAPGVADVRAKAFQALTGITGMGFGDGQVRRALARIPHSVSSLEHLIRQALRELAFSVTAPPAARAAGRSSTECRFAVCPEHIAPMPSPNAEPHAARRRPTPPDAARRRPTPPDAARRRPTPPDAAVRLRHCAACPPHSARHRRTPPVSGPYCPAPTRGHHLAPCFSKMHRGGTVRWMALGAPPGSAGSTELPARLAQLLLRD